MRTDTGVYNNHILRRGALDDLWTTCWLATSALMMVLAVYEERLLCIYGYLTGHGTFR